MRGTTRGLHLLALAGLIFFALPTSGGAASSSICENTAQDAFLACEKGSREEFRLTVANCRYIGDEEARAECWSDAFTDRSDNLDECADQRDARRDVCDLLEEDRYDPDPLEDPSIEFVHPDDIPGSWPVNPFSCT
jgi:hypothetical protein